MDIVVIGAGVVGLACASVLREQGHALTLLDPLAPGEHCSAGNAGCLSLASFVPLALPGTWRKVPGYLADPLGPLAIRWSYLPRLAPWLWRFHRASHPARVHETADAMHALLGRTLTDWRPLAQRAGVPELVRQPGSAVAYESRAAFDGDALGWSLRRERGVRIDLYEGAAIREFDPSLSSRFSHVVHLPGQGHCPNPLRLSKALAHELTTHGARFVTALARGFDVAEGRIRAVRSDAGPLRADAVVIAAGAHSHRLTAMLGTRVPLETERGYHVTLARPSLMPRCPVMSGEGKFFASPMEAGLRIAGTVELAGLEAPPDYRRADVLLRQGSTMFPGLQHGEVSKWMGHRPSLPDSRPIIARSPRVPNAFFAFGHGHVGLAAAAPTGRLIAELVGGRPTTIDVRPFAATRF